MKGAAYGTVHGCTRHGHAVGGRVSPEYKSWASAVERCERPNNKRYAAYGGRGIRMCREWRDSFEAFFAYMGERPSGMSLDRIDVDGHYEPGNCRWATQTYQQRNKRNTKLVTVGNESLTCGEWSERTGVPAKAIWRRLKEGWAPERAILEAPYARKEMGI